MRAVTWHNLEGNTSTHFPLGKEKHFETNTEEKIPKLLIFERKTSQSKYEKLKRYG